MTGTLGCAQRYDALVHWQGGKRQFAHLSGVTQVTWARKLGDYSEASVTLAKGDLTHGCWEQIAPKFDEDGTLLRPGIEPWAHELSLYRDHRLVWQGPIVSMIETQDAIEIEARDVLAWMDRRVVDLNLEGGSPDGDKFRGETGLVLRNIFERTWPGSHESNPYDNPGITEHARIDDTPGKFTETERIWKGSRTVGDLVRDIIQNGIDLFTLGRKVFAVPDFYRIEHAPYRLTDDHLTGDIEVRKLGMDMATEGFVTGQNETAGANSAPVFGKWPEHEGPGGPDNPSTLPFYGRITRFHESQSLSGPTGAPPAPGAPEPPPEQNPSPALTQVAQSIRAYGFPCPVALIIPEQASLAAHAPVTIGQLVPGRVFAVELTNYVNKARDWYRLNEVEVTWTAGSSTGASSGGSSQSSSSSGGSSQSSSSSSSSGGSSSGASSSSTTSGTSGGGPEQVQIGLVTLRQPPIPSENESSSSSSTSSGASSSTASQ